MMTPQSAVNVQQFVGGLVEEIVECRVRRRRLLTTCGAKLSCNAVPQFRHSLWPVTTLDIAQVLLKLRDGKASHRIRPVGDRIADMMRRTQIGPPARASAWRSVGGRSG